MMLIMPVAFVVALIANTLPISYVLFSTPFITTVPFALNTVNEALAVAFPL